MVRLIDADALTIDLFKKAMDDAFLTGNADMHRLLIQVIAHYPTVDAVPVRHGKWKKIPSTWGSAFACSECGEKAVETVMGKPRYEYCPMCGARMDGKRKDDDSD